jgi:D-cysteine desulfhydrase
MLKPLKITVPTPIDEIKNFLRTTRIFVKRDDLNGLLISGNKARKLEYLVSHAKRKKCDTLITCGGIQSNHCRITAAFARRFDMDCHLFLRVQKKPQTTFKGNVLLDKLLGATTHYLTPSQYIQKLEIMNSYADKLKKRKKKGYVIPEGGSNEIGLLGYVDCMKEMAHFIKKENIDAIYCAVGSGGTYAGLLLGTKMLNIVSPLYGVLVCDTISYFSNKILSLCTAASEKFHLNAHVDRSDIHLLDKFIGPGYAIPYYEEMKTITTVALHGIILDPVYTGKAFHGMLRHSRNKQFRKILFIHTGGIFSVFAYTKEYTQALNKTY